MIEHIKTLYQEGAILYLWSNGGADYARQSAQELGLSDYFIAYLPKPTIIIDDQLVSDWRSCRHEFPISI